MIPHRKRLPEVPCVREKPVPVLLQEEPRELPSGASRDNRLQDLLHRGVLIERFEIREDEDEPLL